MVLFHVLQNLLSNAPQIKKWVEINEAWNFKNLIMQSIFGLLDVSDNYQNLSKNSCFFRFRATSGSWNTPPIQVRSWRHFRLLTLFLNGSSVSTLPNFGLKNIIWFSGRNLGRKLFYFVFWDLFHFYDIFETENPNCPRITMRRNNIFGSFMRTKVNKCMLSGTSKSYTTSTGMH